MLVPILVPYRFVPNVIKPLWSAVFLFLPSVRFQGSPGSVRKGKGVKEPHKGRQGKLAWQASGGPGRDLDVLMELQLNKVKHFSKV